MTAKDSFPERRDYLEALAGCVDRETVVVTAFGDSTRDWANVGDRDLNFYLLGGMGHASSLALGIALAVRPRRVVCCETDGGILLNLGSLVTIAGSGAENLSLIVFNNGCYESSGGQPLPGNDTDLTMLARGAGIADAATVTSVAEFGQRMSSQIERNTVTFLDVRISPRSGPRIPFDQHPLEIRERFRVALRSRTEVTTSEEER